MVQKIRKIGIVVFVLAALASFAANAYHLYEAHMDLEHMVYVGSSTTKVSGQEIYFSIYRHRDFNHVFFDGFKENENYSGCVGIGRLDGKAVLVNLGIPIKNADEVSIIPAGIR